jgi:hypothetical protein
MNLFSGCWHASLSLVYCIIFFFGDCLVMMSTFEDAKVLVVVESLSNLSA